MKFGTLQKAFFNVEYGAYSIVTGREKKDGQITITESDGEAALVIEALGEENIPRRKTEGRKQPILVRNRDGEEALKEVTINFPKARGNELRIYRQSIAGFDFEAGDVWYAFTRDGQLGVGCMSEAVWRSIGTNDTSDADFQEMLNGSDQRATPNYVDFAGRRIQRDPAVARMAIEKSGYICEYTKEATPFISKRTNRPYIEAHHLIPLGYQSDFSFSLDVMENIVALNPLWHRAIHHAEPQMVRAILGELSERRSAFLSAHKISATDLIKLYGSEEIV